MDHRTAPPTIPIDVIKPNHNWFDTRGDDLSSTSLLVLDDQGTPAKFLALEQVVQDFAAQIVGPLRISGMVQEELKSPGKVDTRLTNLNLATSSRMSQLLDQFKRANNQIECSGNLHLCSKNLLLYCIDHTAAAINCTMATQDALLNQLNTQDGIFCELKNAGHHPDYLIGGLLLGH
jgi:hypothetical protein